MKRSIKGRSYKGRKGGGEEERIKERKEENLKDE